MPRFSIVIPCFNAETYLDEAIASCLAQTVQDLEVIVIDDGSTDRSFDIASAASASDTRVRVVRQDNRGVGAARNAGLALTSGEFVSFLDADDLIEPAKLMVQGRVLQENPAIGLVLCDGSIIDRDGHTVWERLVDHRRFIGHPSLFEVCFRGGPFPPVVPLVRRALADRVGGFEQDRVAAGWADIGFWMRVALTGTDYYFVPQRLARYRHTRDSMSADHDAMDRAAQAVFAKVIEERPRESARAVLATQDRLRDVELAADQLRAAIADLVSEHDEKRELVADNRRLRQDQVSMWHAVFGLLGRDSRRDDGRAVVIWGAGSAGQTLLGALECADVRTQAFIDNDVAKEGTRIGGLPVRGPSSLSRGTGERPFVLVASVHAAEIEQQLRAIGWHHGDDYIVMTHEVLAELETAGPTLTEASA